jgi:nicotinate-nucleotide pyrophosphorylase (carboxylating)
VTGEPEGLPPLLIEPLVRAALAEDLSPNGDITSQSVVPQGTLARGRIVARARQSASRASISCA